MSANRGEYARKNGARAPFSNQIDVRILQDFGALIGDNFNKIQFSFDIFNVGNLINSNSGVRFNNPFDYRIINFEGFAADGTTPQFSFTEDRLGNDRFNINDFASRWRMRVGIRYNFN